MSHIAGIGIDIIEIDRIQKAMEKNPDRFRARTFTEREVEYCEKKRFKYQHYAARFAAKEAALKALGTGWSQGIGWTEIEVMSGPSGKPEILFHGKAKEIAKSLGVTMTFVSLTHARDYAAAQAILMK